MFVIKIVWYGQPHNSSVDTGKPVPWKKAKELLRIMSKNKLYGVNNPIFAWIEPA